MRNYLERIVLNESDHQILHQEIDHLLPAREVHCKWNCISRVGMKKTYRAELAGR